MIRKTRTILILNPMSNEADSYATYDYISLSRTIVLVSLTAAPQPYYGRGLAIYKS